MWVWKDMPDDVDSFYTVYDYEYSTLSSHLLCGPKPIRSGRGKAILNAKRYGLKRIQKYGCLTAANSVRFAHRRLVEWLKKVLPLNEFQLYPVTVMAKDGETKDFFAVIPLNEVTCTDIKKTKIPMWIVEDKVAGMFSDVVFLENCLGHLSIARDSVTGAVVVSDAVKIALEATGEYGLYFAHPSEISR